METEDQIRKLRWSVEQLDDAWEAARGDLLSLGETGEDPVEAAWAEAHIRRERAVAAVEARVAELVEEREMEARGRRALVEQGRDEEREQRQEEAAVREGRERAQCEKQLLLQQQEQREEDRRVRGPAETVEDRAERELHTQVVEDAARQRDEMLPRPQVEDLEPLLMPYDAPLQGPDRLYDAIKQGTVDLAVVYANMCAVHRCKVNRMVRDLLRTPMTEQVDLSGVFVGRNLLPMVLDVVQWLPRLRRISFARCDIDNALWAKVAPRLRRMRRLEEVDLSGNPAMCDWEALLDLIRNCWRIITLRHKGMTFFPSTAGQHLRDQLEANRDRTG